MRIAQYNIHGVRLVVEAPAGELLEAFGPLVGAFETTDLNLLDAFHIHLSYGMPAAAPGGLKLFWRGTMPDGTGLSYYTADGRRYVVGEKIASFDVNLAVRQARAIVMPGEAGKLESCILCVLCAAMVNAGQHVIHAASLATGSGDAGRAVILAGATGAGKTTSALALQRAGFHMLADDMTLYRPDGPHGPGRVAGIMTRCKVRPMTLDLLPWLHETPRQNVPGGNCLVASRHVAPENATISVAPGIILLLNPRNDDAHMIKPLDKTAALARLTRENVRAYEQNRDACAGKTFAALAELVRVSRTYEASLCPRLEDFPRLVSSLLQTCS